MQGQEEPVVVLVLGGAPKTGVHAEEKFRDLLLECSALRPCREAMTSFNKQCFRSASRSAGFGGDRLNGNP